MVKIELSAEEAKNILEVLWRAQIAGLSAPAVEMSSVERAYEDFKEAVKGGLVWKHQPDMTRRC